MLEDLDYVEDEAVPRRGFDVDDTLADIFERDPREYLGELSAVSIDPSDAERSLLWWTMRGSGEIDETAIEIAQLGYVVGRWECWADDLTAPELGLSANFRRTAYETYARIEMPEEFWDVVFVAKNIAVRLDDFAGDPGLRSRLDYAFEHQVVSAFNEPTEADRQVLRACFNLGIAAALSAERHDQHLERGITEEPFAGEIEILQEEEDPLDVLTLPIEVRGCLLERDDIHGYLLSRRGPLGGLGRLKFFAEGETARITDIVKDGKLGSRTQKVPLPRMVDVLRDLGFARMIWPDGRELRFTSMGVRKVRD